LGSLFSPLPAPTIAGASHRVDTKIYIYFIFSKHRRRQASLPKRIGLGTKILWQQNYKPSGDLWPQSFLFSGTAKLTLEFRLPSFQSYFLNGKSDVMVFS
jgi:hypothetical protein